MTGDRGSSCWRHGQTAWNAEHRFQGSADLPLDDVGREQAERGCRAARRRCARTPIVSSDLARATQTRRMRSAS